MDRFTQLLTLLLTTWLLLAGCDSSAPPSPAALPTFETGTTSVYDYDFRITPLNSSEPTNRSTAVIRSTVASTRDTIDGTPRHIRFDVTDSRQPDGEVSSYWYRRSSTELLEVASRNPFSSSAILSQGDAKAHANSVPATSVLHVPWAVQRRRAMASGEMGTLTQRDAEEIMIRDEPRVVLRSPLLPGRSWTSFTGRLSSRRSVTGRVAIETPAGTFDCVVIRTDVDFNGENSLSYLDYVAQNGLVKRVLTDTLEIRDDDGRVLGEGVTREEVVLTRLEN